MTDRSLALADTDRVEAVLDHLARRLAAELPHDVVLVGLLRRGVPLARRLAERLTVPFGRAPEVDDLEIKRYDDDLNLLHDRPKLDEGTLELDVEGRSVLLVDDVLYSGETLFRAAELVRDRGARRVHCAVLCQRGRPRLPITADWVGLQLDVGPHWIVDVQAPPYEEELGITLNPRPDSDDRDNDE